MIALNISSEGAKNVGPIGPKRVEKELIMRRYKYNNSNDINSRLQLVYGQNPSRQHAENGNDDLIYNQ